MERAVAYFFLFLKSNSIVWILPTSFNTTQNHSSLLWTLCWAVPFCRCQSVFHEDVIKWKHFRVTGPLCRDFTVTVEFPSHRPVARFSVICAWMNGWVLWDWWFETPLPPLWRHCNVTDGSWPNRRARYTQWWVANKCLSGLGSKVRGMNPTHEAIFSQFAFILLSVHGDMLSWLLHSKIIYIYIYAPVPGVSTSVTKLPALTRDARAVMPVGFANPRWWGKRSRHSRRMRYPQFYVSGKRPMHEGIEDGKMNLIHTCKTSSQS